MSPENTWPGAEAGPGDFEDFVRSRSGSLLRSTYVLTGDQHLAEDLVQGALVELYRRWGSVHRHGNPDAYVRKAMYHLAGQRLAARPGGRIVPATMPERGRDDHASATATRLALRQALLGLPRGARAAVPRGPVPGRHRRAMSTGRAVGLDVTIFNPRLCRTDRGPAR